MNKFFGKKNDNSAKNQSLPADPVSLQKAYWTANDKEKAGLLARYADGLSWAELLRLQHLNCAELAADAGKMEIPNDEAVSTPAYKLYLELIERLLSDVSPYRARHVLVWQGNIQQQRPPDLSGDFRNASVTHLGCLEILRLDAKNQPKTLEFVPFDDIQAIMFANPALFRAAHILYDNGQPAE